MKSTTLNEVIQKLVLFSLVVFSSFSAFSQQPFVLTSSPNTKATVVVPTNLSATMHKSLASNSLFIGESGFRTTSVAPIVFAYEVGQIGVRIDNLVAGLAFTNTNEPENEFGSASATTYSCRNMSGISLENCILAQDAIAQGLKNVGEIDVANTQATLLASTWFGEDVTWGFHTSIDLNDKNDAVGDIYQYANAGASLQFNNRLVPEFRVGYTKNLAGNELSYYSVGITFFKKAALNVGWSDEIVANNESNAARSAYFSFAIQTKF